MEKELVKQANKGNKKAFEEIILHYQNDLYRIAKTRFNDEEDINEAIQETIISAYESIGKLFNTDKIKSWLITILINKCNHIYKQKQKNNFISYDNINAERYVSSLDKNDSDLEFNNLINLLNDDEKTIIVLYYAEGYKAKEIAKILKMKESTVRNKILRAKRKIQNDLEEVSNYG